MTRGIVWAVAAIIAVAAARTQTADEEWRALTQRGSAAETTGDYRLAGALYREASRLVETLPPGDRRRAFTFNSLGMMSDAMGQFPEAEAAYRRALAALDESSTTKGVDRAVILANLATLSIETGQTARAQKLLDEAMRVHSAGAVPGDIRFAIVQNSLADLLTVTGRLAEAEKLLNASLEVLEPIPDALTELGIARNNLGIVRMFQGRNQEAIRLLEQALAAFEAARGPQHPILLRTLNNLAAAHYRSKQPSEAGQLWRRALSVAERTVGTEHPMYGEILANYGQYLRANGDKAKGKALVSQGARIQRDSQRRNGIGGIVDVSAFPRK